MLRTRCCAVTLALFVTLASPALSQPTPAGRIKVATGSAVVLRQKSAIPAEVGQLIFESDGLRTGSDGRLGITLKDDTRLSLGPHSEVHLHRFLYAPAEGGFGLRLSILRGIAAYISGRIAKLSHDSIRVETPGAILAVRGTHVVIRVE